MTGSTNGVCRVESTYCALSEGAPRVPGWLRYGAYYAPTGRTVQRMLGGGQVRRQFDRRCRRVLAGLPSAVPPPGAGRPSRPQGGSGASAVMVSRQFVHSFGLAITTFHATSVTVADLQLPDGTRLEGSGVVPDETILPSPEYLAAGRDPALARAIALAGGPVTAEQAGKLSMKK
jgi:hypothetical protein